MPTTNGTSLTKNPAGNPAGGAFPHSDIGTVNDAFVGIFSAGQHPVTSTSAKTS